MLWVWTQVGLESKTEEQSFGEGEILEEGANHEGVIGQIHLGSF